MTTASPRPIRIAVIPGDGIGTEVMPYGVRCVEAAAKIFNIPIEWEDFDFASCAYYQIGTMEAINY